jgi:hypothetical protein
MKVVRILGYCVLGLVVLAAVAIPTTIGARPIIGPRTRGVTRRVHDRTPQRFERGKYIVENVASCFVCHSPHDFTKHDRPSRHDWSR